MNRAIEALLLNVDGLLKKNNIILDATGARFNMFSILGVNHYENTHSAILAEFLNPKGSHALGSKPLSLFLETIGLDDFLVANQARVVTELYGGENGRMDIVIESGGEAIILENKIYAVDQCNQLQRYTDFANKKYDKYQILYLTLDGSQASVQSCGNDHTLYKSISYKDNIIQWLKSCVAVAANYPMVRETLNQYINHIKKLTNQDMNTLQKNEIVALMFKNIEASFCIHENINTLKEKILKDCAKMLADGANMEEYDTNNNGEIYFIYKGYVILFNSNHVTLKRKEFLRKECNDQTQIEYRDIFKKFDNKKWSPNGYSELNFSIDEVETLVKLSDVQSQEYTKLKECVDEIKRFIDEQLINTKIV